MDAFISTQYGYEPVFKNFQELEFGRYYRMDPLSNLIEMFDQANMKKQTTTAKFDIRKGRKIEQEITNTYEQRGSKPVQNYVGFGRSPDEVRIQETPKQRFQFKRIEYKKR